MTFPINVRIDPTQAKQGKVEIERLLGSIERSAKTVSDAMSKSLGGAFREGGAASAIDKQIRSLQQLESAVNPVLSAQRQLAATQRQLTDAVKAGLVSEAEAGRILLRKQAILRSSLDPLGATNAALREETRLLRLSSRGHVVEAQAIQVENGLRAKGIVVTRQQSAELRKLIGERERERGLRGGGGAGGIPLGRFAGAAGAALAVGIVVRTANSFQELQNRIRVVTEGAEELRTTTEAIFDIANEARVDVGGTAQLFSRLTQNTEALGLSQERVLGITESISKAVASSGASSAEASGALQQLSQAFARGTLRGEEFNSVSEQLPEILKVLQRQLGVSKGELRALAEEGKITSQVIVDAFESQAGAIDAQFQKTAPTIGQTFTLLRNEFTKFVGESSDEIGSLVSSLAELAIALKPLAGLLLGIASGVGAVVGKAAEGLTLLSSLSNIREAGGSDARDSTAKEIAELEKELNFQRRLEAENSLLGRRGREERIVALERELEVQRQIIADKESADRATAASNAAKTAAAAEELEAQRRILDIFTRLGKVAVPFATAVGKGLVDAAEKRRKAFEQLAKETRNFEQSILDVTRANVEFEAKQKLLNRAVNSGLITQERASRVLQEFSLQAVESFGELLPVVGDQALAFELYAQALAATNAQFDAGVISLSEFLAKTAEIGRVASRRGIAAGPTGDVATGDIDRGGGLAGGRITAADVGTIPRSSEQRTQDAVRAIEQETELLQLKGREAEIEREILSLKGQEVIETDAQEIQARAALARQFEIRDELEKTAKQQQILVGGAQQFADAMIDAAFAGGSFNEVLSNMVRQLGLAVAKALALKAITAAFGGPAGGASPVSVLNLIPGFAAGGSMTVPGGGGTDSRVIAARVSPGEVVEVRTPAQDLARAGGGSAAPVNVKTVFVSNEREAMLEVMNSEEGERVFVRHMDRNRRRARSTR